MIVDAGTDRARRLRRPLFQKYFAVLFAAVVLPLLASGASEAWFGYLDQRHTLNLRLRAEADAAAARIQGFLDGIPSQMNWTVQAPWGEGLDERHRIDVLRLMRQTPAITEAIFIDGKGVERLRVSQTDPDVEMSGVDHSADPAYLGARTRHLWWGPVTLHRGSEPYMTVAVSGVRPSAGVTIAEINLKLIWEVISAIHVGRTGTGLRDGPFGRARRASRHQFGPARQGQPGGRAPACFASRDDLERRPSRGRGRCRRPHRLGRRQTDRGSRLDGDRRPTGSGGLPTDTCGPLAHRVPAPRRRGLCRGARLLARAANDWADQVARGRRGPYRRGRV